MKNPNYEEPTCSICFEPRTQTYLLTPCGHATFCENCATHFCDDKKCPICRTVVTGKIKVFGDEIKCLFQITLNNLSCRSNFNQVWIVPLQPIRSPIIPKFTLDMCDYFWIVVNYQSRIKESKNPSSWQPIKKNFICSFRSLAFIYQNG